MADNTVLNTGTGGDTVRDKDRAGVKTQIIGIDVDIGTGTEKLLTSGQKSMANSIPVTIASDQSGLPTGGVAAHDAAAVGYPTLQGQQYRANPPKVSADGDVVTQACTIDGKTLTPPWSSAAATSMVNASAAAAQTNVQLLAAPGANKRLVIVEIHYSRDTSGNVKFVEDPAGTPATKYGPHYLPANGGLVATQCYIPLTANKALGITSVGGGNETVTLRVITEEV